MVFLTLSIVLHACIFLMFRAFTSYRVDRFAAIIVNYAVCVLTGLIFLGDPKPITEVYLGDPWVVFAFFLGVLFIFTFNLMAYCTQLYGVTVASVASKIALIMPVLFSLFVLKAGVENFGIVNYFGIALALLAVLFTSVKGNKTFRVKSNFVYLLVPFGVLFFSGMIDISINYANHSLIPAYADRLFPIFAFLSAALIGISIILATNRRISSKSFVAGLLLGIPNYFSIYFLLKALTAFNNNGALLYPVFNVGIILLASLLSIIIFRERLSGLNKLGLLLAVLSIVLISYGDILAG